MNKTIMIAITVAILIASGSAVVVNGGNSVNGNTSVKTVDSYSIAYNNSNGMIGHLSYDTSSSSSIVLASGIYVNGTTLSGMSGMGKLKNSFQIDQGRVAIYGNKYPASIGVMTGSSGKSNMSIHLNETAVRMDQNFKLQSSDSMEFGGMGLSTFSNMDFSSYMIQNANYSGVLVTDGRVSMETQGHVMHIRQYNNTLMAKITPLFAMFVTSGNIKNLIMEHQDHMGNKFSYNATTGNVMGRYVGFNFNTTANTFSNMSLRKDGTNATLFSTISASGNGSFGKGFNVPSFVMGKVQIYGSLFLYANDSYVSTIHDNPVAQSNFIIQNGTLTFRAPQGSNISMFSVHNSNVKMNTSLVTSNQQFQEKMEMGLNAKIGVGSKALRIVTPNLTEFLMVNGGNVSISSNGTIKISTNNMAMVNLVVPPGMHHLGKYQDKIMKAIESGKISTELSINGTSTQGNFTLSLNSTVRTNLTSVSPGHAVVTLNATPGHKKGTDIVIFLSNSFLQNSHNIYIKFDGKIITSTNISGILNDTSNISASYAVYSEQNGEIVIIHVPHFSNHTVDLSTTPYTANQSYLNSSLFIPVMGVVIAAIILVGALVYIRKRK